MKTETMTGQKRYCDCGYAIATDKNETFNDLLKQRDALKLALEHALAYMESDSDDDQEQEDYAEASAALALCGKEQGND